jgi:hypothetical protein
VDEELWSFSAAVVVALVLLLLLLLVVLELVQTGVVVQL